LLDLEAGDSDGDLFIVVALVELEYVFLEDKVFCAENLLLEVGAVLLRLSEAILVF